MPISNPAPVVVDSILKGWVPYFADGFTVLIPYYGDLTKYPPDVTSLGVGSSYEVLPGLIRITAAGGTDNYLYWNLPTVDYVFVYTMCLETGGSGELFGLGVEDAAGDISWVYFDLDAAAADFKHEKVVGGVSTVTVVRAVDGSPGDNGLVIGYWKSDDHLGGRIWGQYAQEIDISGVGPFTRFFIRFNNTSAATGTRAVSGFRGAKLCYGYSVFAVMYK